MFPTSQISPVRALVCCRSNQFSKTTSYNCWFEASENNYNAGDLEQGSERKEDGPDRRLVKEIDNDERQQTAQTPTRRREDVWLLVFNLLPTCSQLAPICLTFTRTVVNLQLTQVTNHIQMKSSYISKPSIE